MHLLTEDVCKRIQFTSVWWEWFSMIALVIQTPNNNHNKQSKVKTPQKLVTYCNLNASHQSPSQIDSSWKPWPARDFKFIKTHIELMCINGKTHATACVQSMFGLGQEIRIVFLQQLERSQRNPGNFSMILFKWAFLNKMHPLCPQGQTNTLTVLPL